MVYVISERNNKFSNFLPENEERLLLLCSLAHDLNHPGVNNAFMINAKNELAAKYNNVAVLENYHAATFLEFLNNSAFDVGVSQEDKEKVIATILATDMAQHKPVLENFVEITKVYEKNNPVHRMSFMKMLIHGADIGNPALNFELATIWSLKIIQEFTLQTWKEQNLGLPVSEFMRIGNDIGKIKRSQIGFIDIFIFPLWKSVNDLIPNIQDLVDNIQNNRNHWETLENL